MVAHTPPLQPERLQRHLSYLVVRSDRRSRGSASLIRFRPRTREPEPFECVVNVQTTWYRVALHEITRTTKAQRNGQSRDKPSNFKA